MLTNIYYVEKHTYQWWQFGVFMSTGIVEKDFLKINWLAKRSKLETP